MRQSLDCPFTRSEIIRIQKVTSAAARIIENDGNARTAPKALKILNDNLQQIQDAVKESTMGRKSEQQPEDFTFSYEEEADPEIFFVPYVWEVIVCVITSASIEWDKNRIRVFPLLDIEEDETLNDTDDSSQLQSMIPQFARDVTDVV
jgi:hypothetical protein